MPNEEREPIRGKVAAIVSNRAIAINRGSQDGVGVGTRFAVLYPVGDDLTITDPDTGATLGSVDLPKVVVKVFRVAGPHLSVARTYRSIPGRKAKPPAWAVTSLMFEGSPAEPERFETLEIDDQDRIDRRINPDDSFVEVGDVVVEVRGDEYDGYSDYK